MDIPEPVTTSDEAHHHRDRDPGHGRGRDGRHDRHRERQHLRHVRRRALPDRALDCWFPRVANASGYQMMPSKGIKWSSWGGRTARGRGTVMANSGYRAPATITLSRRIRDDEGDYIYTRITASIGRGCWYVAPGERDCDPPGHTTHYNGRVAF